MTASMAPRVDADRHATSTRPHAVRTVLALAALCLIAPLNFAVVALAVVWSAVRPPRRDRPLTRRTVLISGGKMTKALQLARSFHQGGHRVILVESAKYRLTGHRFSRAVDRFYVVPESHSADYATALLRIIRYEAVDVYIPVCSPAASLHDAQARCVISNACEVMHPDLDLVLTLDDKAEFSCLAASLGLRVPESHRITAADQIEDFPYPADRSFILKRIAYNPVGRMNLVRLSRDTRERNTTLAQRLGIRADDPWVLQEFISGPEFCAHAVARNGRLQVYACSPSSGFQVNYHHVDKPEILSWMQTFVGRLGLTGQVSVDFIEGADGHPYAIECNPRAHSAVTTFHDHSGLADAYLRDRHPLITPRPESRPTYWLYHEMWRLMTQNNRRRRLATILAGRDAVFAVWDPVPFFALHHVQIPVLLWHSLIHRRSWARIDFNIGKLVEPDGD